MNSYNSIVDVVVSIVYFLTTSLNILTVKNPFLFIDFTFSNMSINSGRIMSDFNIEQGVSYKYMVRRLNGADIPSDWHPVEYWAYASSRVKTIDLSDSNVWHPGNIVTADFEDSYLFDGVRQLRI